MKKGKIKALVEFWCEKKMAEIEGRFNNELHDNIIEVEKRADNLLERVQKLEAIGHSNHVADADRYRGLMDYQKFAYAPIEKPIDGVHKENPIEKANCDHHWSFIARKNDKYCAKCGTWESELKADESVEKRDFTNQEVYNLISSEIETFEYLIGHGHLSGRGIDVITRRLSTRKTELSQIKL